MRMDEGRMGVKGKKWKRNLYMLYIEKKKCEECRTMYKTKFEEYLMTEEGHSIMGCLRAVLNVLFLSCAVVGGYFLLFLTHFVLVMAA
jgi:hypothetical protein